MSKLFIWNEPYSVAWGSACLYVIADSLEEARQTALTTVEARYGNPIKGAPAVKLSDLGEPTRVLSPPYAEVYEWSE